MTQVKICGLSTALTMNAALHAGADFVGLVFFAKSPRHVSIGQASHLASLARGRAKIVTLVVDADDQLLRSIATEVNPDYIQAHGQETPTRIAAIHGLTGIAVYKAVKVRDVAHVVAAESYRSVSPFLLYDAMPPEGAELPGGNGLAFDWNILATANQPFMLAGGLTPETVAHAVVKTAAAMVDVSSGVESSPGIKDAGLIAKFITTAKSA